MPQHAPITKLSLQAHKVLWRLAFSNTTTAPPARFRALTANLQTSTRAPVTESPPLGNTASARIFEEYRRV